MNYSIIYYRYYVFFGTSPNYWGNRPSHPGEPLGRNTLLKTVRTPPKASLVGEKRIDWCIVWNLNEYFGSESYERVVLDY